MSPPRPAPDDPADREALARHAAALADGVDRLLPGWVERSVVTTMRRAGRTPTDDDLAAARAAGEAARAEVGSAVRALIARDVDEQETGPLALLRRAVAHPTAVLSAAGVPPVDRDAEARRLQPDDVYDLGPAAFADIHPDLHEPGLVWGAAKAHVVLARRRREGQRSAPPFIDEHSTTVPRGRDDVWAALDRSATRALVHDRRSVVDRLWGTADPGGFHVRRRVAPERIVLDGSHRFARYRLELVLDEEGDASTRVRARSYASFDGIQGRIYRALVIRTRVHVVATRSLLRRLTRVP